MVMRGTSLLPIRRAGGGGGDSDSDMAATCPTQPSSNPTY